MRARTLPPLDAAKVLPFRRPSAAVRVRKRSLWASLARPFLQALGVVGLPAAAAVWALSAPSFALASVELTGNRYVDGAWVERALAPLAGENLLTLPIDEVRARLAGHPWIADIAVEKRLPNRLRLAVAERRPAALLRRGEELVYLDRDGRVIAPLAPGRGPADLLLVSVGATTDVDLAGAFDVAAELERAVPRWAPTLSEVESLGAGDFRLFLGALPFPLLVRRGTLAARLPALEALLPELERRYRRLLYVDLRAPRRIVFQPLSERS